MQGPGIQAVGVMPWEGADTDAVCIGPRFGLSLELAIPARPGFRGPFPGMTERWGFV